MRSPSFIIFLVLAVLIAGFIGALAYFTFQPPSIENVAATLRSPDGGLKASATPPTRPVIASSDPVRGDTSAPLSIVEFGDFFCPACAEVEIPLNSVLQQYKGRVKLVWKDMPNVRTHPLAQKAAEAARCAASQGKFWEYHDALLTRQSDVASDFMSDTSGTPGAALPFIKIARELHLGVGAFEECLNTGALSDLVERSFNEAILLRVDATPYFFVEDRRISGLISFAELQFIIDVALK